LKIEKREKSRKAIRRIDTEVVKRIITILHDEGMERKTKISLKAHLSYDKCLLYLEWLELMGLIRKENDDNNFELINLTEKGNELYVKYSESRSYVS
jgi:predicted transcriptional regulator